MAKLMEVIRKRSGVVPTHYLHDRHTTVVKWEGEEQTRSAVMFPAGYVVEEQYTRMFHRGRSDTPRPGSEGNGSGPVNNDNLLPSYGQDFDYQGILKGPALL